MRLTMNITEKQTEVLLRALECFSRMGMGQYYYSITDNLHKLDFSMAEAREVCDKLKKIIYPELAKGAYYGITMAEDQYKISWDMYQTIRQKVAFHKHPEGGHTVDFDNPLKVGSEPLPNVSI